MKIHKKVFISIVVGILTTTSITATTDQAQTTTSNVNSEQGKLILNHKTRVYNKKGKKKYSYLKTNGLLKKGASVRYVGKIKALSDPDTKRYSFNNYDMNWFYLPYKTIKGKQYYNIGHGGYIKAVNVRSIDGYILCVNYDTVRIASIPLSTNKGNGKANLVNKKAELFYEVLNSPARSEECNFVKVSTAKYLFGKYLKPTNTATDVMPANIEKNVKK